MKNIFVFACVLASVFFVACSGSDSKSYDESLAPANSSKAVTPLTIADTLLSDTSSIRPVAQVALPGNKATTTTTTLSGNTATAKAGLNPAHGQPGHRCDIAVGASLSTPVTKPAASTTTPQVQSVTSNSAPTSTPTPSVLSGSGVKLNPPHGQPGHDCAVEVGKPLKN